MNALGMDEIRQAIAGQWLSRGTGGAVRGVCTDSRAVGKGDLFIPLRGERFDAHLFLPEVAAAGCPAALANASADVSPQVAAAFPFGVLAVDDTGKALERLGAYYRKTLETTVVAVTGSNGKTTVKRMIHHILSTRLKGSCSPKSFNNNIGVPLTLLGANSGDAYVICEVGSNAPGEIAALGAIVQPDIAVISSVGKTHLEKLGSIEGVAAEKASLLGHLKRGGKAIVWADSGPLARAVAECHRPLVRFGQGDDADLRLTAYEAIGHACRFQINGEVWANMPLPGMHNATNALAAIAVAMQFGFSPDDAAGSLADFAAVDGRLQAISCGPISLINDAYNANPSSVLAAADVLACGKALRRVMIVGDMRELGADSSAIHEQTGREIAERGIDLLVGIGEFGQLVAAGAAGAGLQSQQFATVASAAADLPVLLRPGDMVLIKGSRAMAMEQLVEPIRAAFCAAPADHTKGIAN